MPRRLLAAVLVAASCGACGGAAEGACGPITREALDSNSLVHVLPGAPTPSYLTDPPTSGSHQPAPSIHGAQDDPIAPQIQVGILEEGRILVQYRGLDADDEAAVRALVSEEVVVAPAESLPGDDAIVATAWLAKLRCDALDVDAIEHFVAERAGKAPGHP